MKPIDEVIHYYENRKQMVIGLAAKQEMEEAILHYLKEYQEMQQEERPKWIPFTMRELTEEEKEYLNWDSVLTCPLPDNYEEILVSDGINVWFDTFYNDDYCDLESGRSLEGLAWMPFPKPWKKDF